NAGLANGWHHVAAVFASGAVTSSKLYIDGVAQTMSQRANSPISGNANIGTTLYASGWGINTNYRFSGRLDELRVYDGELTAAQVSATKTPTHACDGALLAQYRFEEASWSAAAGQVLDSSGNALHATAVGSPLPTPLTVAPAVAGGSGTCGYARLPGPNSNGGAFTVASLPVSMAAGDKTTVAFWVYWEGGDYEMAAGFTQFSLFFFQGSFGFNSANSDIWGISSAGLANGWHHVIATFTQGSVTGSTLYIDGVSQTMSQRAGTPTNANANVGSTLYLGGWNRVTNDLRLTGYLDEASIYYGSLTAAQVAGLYGSTHACPASALPGGFNAFESATAAGITGVIKTKIAGSAFTVDVVALDTARTAVMTSFTGGVKVEFLNAADNSGALDATTSCRSTWSAVTSGASSSITFAGGDAGRKAVSLTENEAWKDVRLRMTTPATGTPSVTACSVDRFAIRPDAFAAFSVTDATSATAGTGRSLANVGATGGNVHKAGQPFTLRATAVNSAGNTTVRYADTPAHTVSACVGAACSVAQGSLSAPVAAVAGVLANTAATYSEAGSFGLQLNDTTFAAVDAADGSSLLERTISSPVVSVGRFVPDHFDVTLLTTPVLRTFNSASCLSRSFTYIGQPFGYATAPQATVLARNAAGATTTNYAGSLWKLTAASIAQGYTPTPASPALDVSAIVAPTLTSNSDGTGLVVGAAADRLAFTRASVTPLPSPFNANIALAWSATDATEAGVTGNGSIATTTPLSFASIAFDAGALMRYGVLRLTPAYGSELVDLPVQAEAQYWDGVRMATNAADQCTAFSTSALAMSNYQRNLAACETAISAATTTLANGRAFLKLKKPGTGNNGSVDLSLQLGASPSGQTCATVGGAAGSASTAALPWLQGKWGGASAFDQNPLTRASFGQYRSPMVYMRENF
ncbi:MAG: DUF6701 domain-containing protein, partial [Rubrivivax sp.]